jgi:hypothetical protein
MARTVLVADDSAAFRATAKMEASGARGFVPKAELASPGPVELLGPP